MRDDVLASTQVAGCSSVLGVLTHVRRHDLHTFSSLRAFLSSSRVLEKGLAAHGAGHEVTVMVCFSARIAEVARR